MASVELKNVKKIYNKNIVAVDSVSIVIRDKEFVVLVGPSGCGKSTILRMIAGLEEISEGTISIDKKIVNDVPPKDRDIAMVFQNYALYPHMTVYENLAFGLKMRRFSKPEMNSRVNDAAEILGITHLLARKPRELSGGQRQRVAVGRAIVRKPKVFLFDEPLSNLDAKLRVQMRTEISKLHSRLGATMIYVTHDQVEAMTMGNRIVVLRDGRIQQMDTPLNLYQKPSNRFVAGFIGSPAMNFLKGKVVRNNGLWFQNDNLKVKVTRNHHEKLKKFINQDVVFGIRPEDIEEWKGEKSASHRKLECRVEVIEPMGNEVFVYLSVGKDSIVARMHPEANPAVNSEYFVGIDMNKAYFFDSHLENTIY